MSDSFVSEALATVLAAVLTATGPVVSRGLPSVPPRTTAPADPSPQPADARPPVLGRDVSWPNCPTGMGIRSRRSLGKPMPPPSAGFVVIGLTNGPAFHPNPCLAGQVQYAKAHHLWTAAYAVVTYPTPGQLRRYAAAGPRRQSRLVDRLFNTGWAQARGNVAAMRAAGLRSPAVWVDVEPVTPPAPWSGSVRANRAVVEGAVAHYRSVGLRVGFYSTTHMWRSIVGRLAYGFPEWRTAGPASRRAALRMCRSSPFQGGPAVLAQWYTTEEDFDVLCPAAGSPASVLRRYFVRS